jgi:hypothetical protein
METAENQGAQNGQLYGFYNPQTGEFYRLPVASLDAFKALVESILQTNPNAFQVPTQPPVYV